MNLSSSRKLAVVLHLLSKLLFVFFRSNDLGKSISTKHNLIKENMHLTGFKRPVSSFSFISQILIKMIFWIFRGFYQKELYNMCVRYFCIRAVISLFTGYTTFALKKINKNKSEIQKSGKLKRIFFSKRRKGFSSFFTIFFNFCCVSAFCITCCFKRKGQICTKVPSSTSTKQVSCNHSVLNGEKPIQHQHCYS
jgi:hypothetical protein